MYMYMFLTSTNNVLCPSAQSWETQVTGSNQSPNPNNPAEYCSTIPPLQQAQASGVLCSPPPTVMVPVGVLKQPGNEGTTFTRNKNTVAINPHHVKFEGSKHVKCYCVSPLQDPSPGSRGGSGLLMGFYLTGTQQRHPNLQRPAPTPPHRPCPSPHIRPKPPVPSRQRWGPGTKTCTHS